MSISEIVLLVLIIIAIVLADVMHSRAYKRRMKREENKVLLLYAIYEEVRKK